MRQNLLLLSILLLTTFNALAQLIPIWSFYDNGFYYTITSDSTVEVSYDNVNKVYYGYESYSGDIVIPSSAVSASTGKHYTVTRIGNEAFSDCKTVTSIIIPNSITSIGDHAFRDCINLTSLSVPNSLYDIGYKVLEGTKWLEKKPNGLVYVGLVAYGYKGAVPENVALREGIKGIAGGAFCNWEVPPDLISIVIPNSVIKIGYGAFQFCKKLTSVSMGNSVTTIGDYAFWSCTSLCDMKLPNTLTTIGYNAFYDCEALDFDIPESVTSIGGGAFFNCASLKRISIPNVKIINAGTFACCTSVNEVMINPTIMELPSNKGSSSGFDYEPFTYGAFENCSSLNRVTIGDSLEHIPGSTFSNCVNLKKISFGKSIRSFGAYGSSFTGVYPTEVTWNAVNCVGFNWGSCSHFITSDVERVEIGEEVEIIPTHFMSFSKITEVIIPNSVRTIGNWAFEGCGELTSVILSNSLNEIQYGAFDYCTSLKSLIIPNSVTSIAERAFAGCKGMKSITFGNTVATIGESVLNSCTGLNSVTCLSDIPPTVDNELYTDGTGRMQDLLYRKAILYVPKESIEAYRATFPWSKFTNIMSIESSILQGDANGDGEVNVADINAIIDGILSGVASGASDVNGDGEVSIADVNALIDLILMVQ